MNSVGVKRKFYKGFNEEREDIKMKYATIKVKTYEVYENGKLVNTLTCGEEIGLHGKGFERFKEIYNDEKYTLKIVYFKEITIALND